MYNLVIKTEKIIVLKTHSFRLFSVLVDIHSLLFDQNPHQIKQIHLHYRKRYLEPDIMDNLISFS